MNPFSRTPPPHSCWGLNPPPPPPRQNPFFAFPNRRRLPPTTVGCHHNRHQLCPQPPLVTLQSPSVTTQPPSVLDVDVHGLMMRVWGAG